MATASNSTVRSPRQELLAGARDIIPLVVGAIPFGIIFGTLAQGSGLSFGATLGMSAFVFAGSSQFIALGLLAAGSTLPLIVLTTVVVNLRHMLYAASLLPYVQGDSQRWKAIIGFFLTDEAFAIAIRRYLQPDLSPHKHWYYLGAGGAMYGNWVLCTWLGLTVGQLIPNAAAWGLDFAMVATFIGMIVPYATTRPMVGAIAVAGLVAVLANGLPHKLGLMVAAIAGVAAGFWLETRVFKSEEVGR
ncbi:AzlC family ABC transporter permease [Nodosilinea sp. LEGE 07298]|uniref:AzlC family ABC transporter permease n=1 Tax=Nodosilinea sp. LEGE 07298 TaxID=2777970 RepID=UPI001882212D|nr:AzlC family ABC transporter permease [Nodosilinea sp. LEGE 07298]MBE9108718.1 AzlC family ABC transporter permease [Nodosilinea sp. LEGE 07298]